MMPQTQLIYRSDQHIYQHCGALMLFVEDLAPADWQNDTNTRQYPTVPGHK